MCGNPHFENICISSSSFVLLLKAAFLRRSRRGLPPPQSYLGARPACQAKPSLAINNLTGAPWPNPHTHARTHTQGNKKNKTKQKQKDLIKPFQLSVVFFYCRRVRRDAPLGSDKKFQFSYDCDVNNSHTVCEVATSRHRQYVTHVQLESSF